MWFSRLNRARLLLSYAVYSSHPPHEMFAVDWDYTPIIENLLQCFYGATVVFMSKNGCEYDPVCNVEIGITRGQALQIARLGACSTNNTRHRQRKNVQWLIACIRHVPQAL